MLIKLFNKRAVPKSEYLRESQRLILDVPHRKIEIKQEKDKNKQSYLNSQGCEEMKRRNPCEGCMWGRDRYQVFCIWPKCVRKPKILPIDDIMK